MKGTAAEAIVCYVDYEKAFDCVDWIKLMTTLQNIGVGWKDRKSIWNVYDKHVAYVRIGDGLSTAYAVGGSKTRMFSITIVVLR